MSDFPWLTTLIVVPLIGAVVTAFLPSRPGAVLPKQVALLFTVLTFAVAVGTATQYDTGAGMQLTETHVWIEAFGAYYAVGVDGIALTLVLLTTLLVPLVVLASWNDADAGNTKAFFSWMLARKGLGPDPSWAT